jgi:hypothetical protein
MSICYVQENGLIFIRLRSLEFTEKILKNSSIPAGKEYEFM